jgi:hypothetical protein
VFALRFLEKMTFASRWTLLPLRLVMGVGFLAHALAKWNRGPANLGCSSNTRECRFLRRQLG